MQDYCLSALLVVEQTFLERNIVSRTLAHGMGIVGIVRQYISHLSELGGNTYGTQMLQVARKRCLSGTVPHGFQFFEQFFLTADVFVVQDFTNEPQTNFFFFHSFCLIFRIAKVLRFFIANKFLYKNLCIKTFSIHPLFKKIQIPHFQNFHSTLHLFF